ncbi:MAG: recombinase RecA [Clostridiales bacterium]|jgi:recombination protein RecA|nr:recombinase RecA [Clostridiales bacterium]
MEKKTKTIATPKTDEEKEKALELAIAQIEKQYGKGSIMKLTDNTFNDVETISTGCLSVDLAVGIGGLPRGRIVEIYGPESSGKTTLSLHVIAEAQKSNGNVAFIDAEHALDPAYAGKLGIDLARLYISQPDNGEQALDITESLVRSGAMDIIVIDSVAALTPKVEIDGEMGESKIGAHARLMSQALRKLTSICSKTKTCIIFINQLREKVGVMFGSPEVTTGGKALKFYSSIRLDVRRGEQVKEGTTVIGNHTKVKVVKNKMAPPFKTAEFDIIFGKGISRAGCIIDLGTQFKIIAKSGSWFSYNDERLCQGREALRSMLEQNKELAAELEAKIRAVAAEKSDELFASSDDEDESVAQEAAE